MRIDRRRGSHLAIGLMALSVVAHVAAEEARPGKRPVSWQWGLGASAENCAADESNPGVSSFRQLANRQTTARDENPFRDLQGTIWAGMGLLAIYYVGRHRLISLLCILWFLCIILLSAIQFWRALSWPRSDPGYAHQLGYAEAKAFTQTAIAVFGIVIGVRRMIAPPEESPLAHENRVARQLRAEARALRLDVEGARAVLTPTWEIVRRALSQIGSQEPSHVTLFTSADEYLEAAGVPSRLFLVCRRRSGGGWAYWSLSREVSTPGLGTQQAPLTLEDALAVFHEFFEHDRMPPGFRLSAAPEGTET